MKSSKNRTGSIYYDKKDKRFRCIYYIKEKNNLEETRKTKSFLTEKEAKDFLKTIECQKGNDIYIKNNGIPLNQLMRALAKRKLDMNIIKDTQYNRILSAIKKLEQEPFTKKNIEDITSDEIQAYLNSLKNYSQSTISKEKDQFSQAFKYALNKGYILENPMIEIIEPKSNKPPKIVRALEIEEQQMLTNYLMNIPLENEPYKVAYLMQMYLGLRIGEALALKTSDINLARNLIHISRTLTFDKNHKLIMGEFPKTFAGIRDVPIPKFILEEIINQMRLAENHKENLLFVNSQNNYADPKNANKFLKNTLKKVNINDITTHSLRHTYGTRCIEAGMRAVALQRLMGHSDISVTMSTYVSVFNKYKEAELEKLNDYYINNDIFNQKPKLIDKKSINIEKPIISEKRQRLMKLFKMIEDALLKGTIPISEYEENVKYLKEQEKILDNEEEK